MTKSTRTHLQVFAVALWASACSDADAPTPPDAGTGSSDGAPTTDTRDAALDLAGDTTTGDAAAMDGRADAPGDAQSDARGDTQADVQVPWPPPGVLYLTKLAREADYDQLRQGRLEVPFFMRRRGNEVAYPYPWDSNECIFHVPISHLSFLRQIDPDRALHLYYVDAKTMDGNLIAGRFIVDETAPKSVTVLFENTVGLMAFPIFMFEASVTAQMRERFMRCAPFGTSFTFLMMCADGEACPLP